MSETGGRLVVLGSLSAALGYFFRLFARLLFLFVAGRMFGAALFGAYSVGVALVEVAVIAGGLGTRWLIFPWLDAHEQEGGRSSAHRLLDATAAVAAASGLIAAATMLIVAVLPPAFLATNAAAAIFWLAPTIVFQALIELLLAATRWRRVMRYEVIGKSIVQPYASIAVALIAWRSGVRDHGLILAYAGGTLAAFAYSLFAIGLSFERGAFRNWRLQMAPAGTRRAAIAANTGTELVEALFSRIDIYAVGILLGESAVGAYAMAKQLAVSLRQVRQSFDGMLIPLMAKTISTSAPAAIGRALASATRLILVAQLPIAILFATAGASLLGLLGPGLAAGYGALVALTAAETVQGAFGVGDMLFVYRSPGLGVAITAAATAFGLAAIVALSAAWGLGGAGLAILLACLARALARRHFLRSRFGLVLPLAFHLGPLLAAAAAIAAGLALGGGLLSAVPALLLYAGLLSLWVRLTGARLMPEGLAAP